MLAVGASQPTLDERAAALVAGPESSHQNKCVHARSDGAGRTWYRTAGADCTLPGGQLPDRGSSPGCRRPRSHQGHRPSAGLGSGPLSARAPHPPHCNPTSPTSMPAGIPLTPIGLQQALDKGVGQAQDRGIGLLHRGGLGSRGLGETPPLPCRAPSGGSMTKAVADHGHSGTSGLNSVHGAGTPRSGTQQNKCRSRGQVHQGCESKQRMCVPRIYF